MTETSLFAITDVGIHITGSPAVDNDDAPKMLYHYTCLSSLALILRNKTLRLMPLSGMDDKQEKETSDVNNLGRFFFVSSWTDNEKESIPMWKMYANPDSGVRIGLPPNPFLWEILPAKTLVSGIRFPVPPEQYDVLIKSLIHSKDLERGLFCTEMGASSIIHKVDYTDEQDLLMPIVASDNSTINFGSFGLVKHSGWYFQREWRYMLRLFPPDPEPKKRDLSAWLHEMFLKMRAGNLEEPCSYYDLKLDPDLLSHIEITPSPEMSPGNKVLLDLLIKEYCPNATIHKSSLIDTL